MILSEEIVIHFLVHFATVLLRIVSHEHKLINLGVPQELILQDGCVALQGLEELAGLFLGIGIH